MYSHYSTLNYQTHQNYLKVFLQIQLIQNNFTYNVKIAQVHTIIITQYNAIYFLYFILCSTIYKTTTLIISNTYN
jgi:hypothetical protein